MLLHHGESLVRSAYASLDRSDHPSSANGPGVLYLTSHRIVFETAASRGLVRGRDARMVLDASLHAVRDVAVRRGRLGRPRLVVDLGESRPSFDVLEPEDWTVAIAQAKRSLPTAGSAGLTTLTIERQVVKVRCRYCGNLGNEVDGRCPTCGAPL
jgi:hypothetical protein